ncbi:MAG: AtpZ/AtpI family protein [Flavisolibacter sp.]
MSKQQKQSNNNDIMRYASLGAQIFVSLGIAVFAGYKVDKWIHIAIPLFVWLLPLLVLCILFYNLIRETSKKNNKK